MLGDCLCRLRVNSQGSEIGRFDEKALAVVHSVNRADFGKYRNSIQTSWNGSYMLGNGIKLLTGLFMSISVELATGLVSTL